MFTHIFFQNMLNLKSSIVNVTHKFITRGSVIFYTYSEPRTSQTPGAALGSKYILCKQLIDAKINFMVCEVEPNLRPGKCSLCVNQFIPLIVGKDEGVMNHTLLGTLLKN